MNSVEFFIPGTVTAKGRPKFSTAGRFVQTYTPEKTRSYEAVIRDYAEKAMEGKELSTGALKIKITVILPKPKQPKTLLNVITRPDIDNYFKIIADSLNCICYHDDSQIASCEAHKVYVDNFMYDSIGVMVYIEQIEPLAEKKVRKKKILLEGGGRVKK